MDVKLGKQPATHDPKDLLFMSYRDEDTVAEITPPAKFGHEKLITADGWGMLANDRVGDCVFAGGAHETMLWNREAGKTALFDDTAVVSDYAAVTGYIPSIPETDRGTNVHTAMNYRRHTGIIDANGKRHKIGAYVKLEPGDWNQLLEAAYLFSAVGIGIEFPAYAMDQFRAGKPWAYHYGAQHIEGGHYIPVVGHQSKLRVDVVTWGRIQQMTRSFYEHHCDEAYAILSVERLKDGKSLEGFNLQELTSDLGKL